MKYYKDEYYYYGHSSKKGLHVLQDAEVIVFKKGESWHNPKGPAHISFLKNRLYHYWINDCYIKEFDGNSKEIKIKWRKYIKLLVFS